MQKAAFGLPFFVGKAFPKTVSTPECNTGRILVFSALNVRVITTDRHVT